MLAGTVRELRVRKSLYPVEAQCRHRFLGQVVASDGIWGCKHLDFATLSFTTDMVQGLIVVSPQDSMCANIQCEADLGS